MAIDVTRTFNAILTQAALTLSNALPLTGIAVTRKKKGQRWSTDVLPAAFVVGGLDDDVQQVFDNAKTREYQVFVFLCSASNYQFEVNTEVITNIREAVQKALHAPDNFSPAGVFKSRIVGHPQYEDDMLEAGYDWAVVEMWFEVNETQT